MDIHKPKAARTWREFLVEIGTIVIGILIALSLDQLVQSLREHWQAAEARQNIRLEIANDLGLLGVRAATEPCVTKRLDEVAALIKEAEAGRAIEGPVWIGRPAVYALNDGEYRSEAQTGHLSLLASDEQAAYASIYGVFAQYAQAENAEQQAWANLRTLEQISKLSDAADWQLLSAMQQARTARWTEEATARGAARVASPLGIVPTKTSRFRLQSACVSLHTPRPTALALIAKGRTIESGHGFDEP